MHLKETISSLNSISSVPRFGLIFIFLKYSGVFLQSMIEIGFDLGFDGVRECFDFGD